MSDLHIPNLTIKNFRGIDELEIPCLGRVTLIVGRNSIGKTTILDAVRIYAERGAVTTLWDMLRSRDEIVTVEDEDGDEISEPDWPAMFRNRDVARPISISAMSSNGTDDLVISLAPSERSGDGTEADDDVATDGATVLNIRFSGIDHDIPWIAMPGSIPGVRLPPIQDRSRYLRRLRMQKASGWPFPRIITESLGPHILDNGALARFWDEVTLTDAEQVAFDALQLASGKRVRGAAVVANRGTYRLAGDRLLARDRLVIGLADEERRVPLRRLGDGSVRLFGLALALANCRGGVLLVDEIENGVHYGIMPQMWQIILKLAHENAVQVVATTHSEDCVQSFASVTANDAAHENSLYRLDRETGKFRAVQYRGEKLMAVAKHQIEVR